MAGEIVNGSAAFTAAELEAFTGGRLTRPTAVMGVSIDSRTAGPGQLFVAIAGDRFDGHDYAAAAVAAGASALVVTRELPVDIPQLVVSDTLLALQNLARHHRERFDLPVVALTGSNGKTTTKEMIAAVLSPLGPVRKTPGNLNNHIGVPLTLLGLDRSHRAAVVEMGMNHPGEIRQLAALARPGVAVITNAGRAHLEGLGSREAVVLAKSEIAEGLNQSDTLILFGDDLLLREKNQSLPCGHVTFGFGPTVDFTATDIVERGLAGTTFQVEGFGRVSLQIPGRHNVLNALAALAVSSVLRVPPAEAVVALAGVSPARGRMELRSIAGLTIIDDSYNANPDSMRAALDLLREAPSSGRRIAILGEMLELGPASQSLHREIGAAASFVDRLFVIGPTAAETAAAAIESGLSPEAVSVARDHDGLIRRVLETVRPGDLLLVKGSRGMALEKVVQALERESLSGSEPETSPAGSPVKGN
jgi:UDP-N-acetylmuramoyl-tripeptide--D-alanyl-D-alanine ligase